MKFHHVCLIVSDLDRAIEMWTKLFDFKVDIRTVSPDDAIAAAPDSNLVKLMEDIWGMKGPRTKLALLSSPGGALLELQEAVNPPIQKTPVEYLNYYHTGMRELAFQVDGIDGWFEKVRKAGFKTQTDYVWSFGDASRSFLFYDHDHHLIQLWESEGPPSW